MEFIQPKHKIGERVFVLHGGTIAAVYVDGVRIERHNSRSRFFEPDDKKIPGHLEYYLVSTNGLEIKLAEELVFKTPEALFKSIAPDED